MRHNDRLGASARCTGEVHSVRRIVANPEILGGKPSVEGTRWRVSPG